MKKIILIMFILNFFCSKKYINKNINTKRINNNERFEYFKKNIDSVYNEKIYNQITDTTNKWINLNVEYWNFNDKTYHETKWIISKYIYFNSKKDKLVARIPLQVICESCVLDHVYTIIGQKKDSAWWFYQGESYAVLREWVTKDIHKPLPFEKLEEIGIDETMDWYYYEKDTTICDFFDHSDSTKIRSHLFSCIKKVLIINDEYFNSKDWDCEHEVYIDYHYEKKYEGKVNDSTNK